MGLGGGGGRKGGVMRGNGEYRGGRGSNEGGWNRRRKGGERGRDKHSIRNFTDTNTLIRKCVVVWEYFGTKSMS